jgi:hypothetical protein
MKSIKERVLERPSPEELQRRRTAEMLDSLERLDLIFSTPRKVTDPIKPSICERILRKLGI